MSSIKSIKSKHYDLMTPGGITPCAFTFLWFREWFFAFKKLVRAGTNRSPKQRRSRNRPTVFTFLQIFYIRAMNSRLQCHPSSTPVPRPGCTPLQDPVLANSCLALSLSIFVCLQKGVPCSAIGGVGFSTCSPQ
jgi:hypothetical protein